MAVVHVETRDLSKPTTSIAKPEPPPSFFLDKPAIQPPPSSTFSLPKEAFLPPFGFSKPAEGILPQPKASYGFKSAEGIKPEATQPPNNNSLLAANVMGTSWGLGM